MITLKNRFQNVLVYFSYIYVLKASDIIIKTILSFIKLYFYDFVKLFTSKNKLNLRYRFLLNIKCTKLIRIKIPYKEIARVYVVDPPRNYVSDS